MRARPAPAVARLLALALLFAGTQAVAAPRAEAAGGLDLSTAALSFGPLTPGPAPQTGTVTVTNNGAASATVGSPVISGADKGFFWASETCGGGSAGTKTLTPGQSCAIVATFTAPVVGSRSGTLSIPNSAGAPLTVALSASTLMPDIDVTPPTAFAATAVGDTSVKVVTVASTGDIPLELGHATVTGANANQFAVIEDECALAPEVADGDTCTVTVRFRPTSAGAKSATLSVPSNAGEAATVPLSGATGDPFLSPSPGGFVFPSTVVGSYLSGPVTVSNTGPGAIDYTGAALSGTHANQYAVDDSCLLADRIAATPCVVKVFFRPTASGSKTATLTLSASGQPDRTISLAGLGAAPVRSLEATPSSLNFGSVPVATSSASLGLTITNIGNVPQVVSMDTFGIAPATDFTVDYNCPVALPPGEECSARVWFRPTTTGARSANLTVVGLGTTTVVPLSGTGTTASPGVTMSPGLRQFGNVAVGATSANLTQTVSNPGPGSFTITGSPSVGGPSASYFQVMSTTCTNGAVIAASSSCTVSVRFAPTSYGLKAATLTVPTSAASPSTTFALNGIATQGYPHPSTIAPIDFGSSRVGVSTASQTVTVTNTGNGSMDVTAPTITGSDAGHFDVTGGTCTGATVPKNGTCTVTVAFDPTARGARSASLRVTTTAGIQSVVSLLGTGRGAVANIDTVALSYGAQPIGASSAPAPQTATITNTGDASLSLDAANLTGTGASQFLVTESECAGTVVAPGDDCRITLAFAPTSRGAKTATLTVPTDAGSPLTIGLSGTGTQAVASINPTTKAFGSQAVGTPTAPSTIIVANTGNDPLDITTVTFGGSGASSFDLMGSTCLGASLAQNASCTVSVRFNPASAGAKSATLVVAHNGSGDSVATLTGTGLAPVATPSTTELDFGDVKQGDTSDPETVTLTNTGTANLVIGTTSVTGPDSDAFDATDDDCAGTSVAPGSSCDVAVTFTAGDSGEATASLSITHNTTTSPTVITLSGNSMPTSDIKILGIGSLYTGHDHLVTRTVASSGSLMKYKLGIVNEDTVAHTYKFDLTSAGAAATAQIWSTGIGPHALPTDGSGNFVTGTVLPGKTLLFELRVTPTAPGQVTSSVDVDLLSATDDFIEGVSTQTNTAAPVNGTSGFELFAGQGSQPLVGGPVSGQTVTSPALNVNQSTTFKLRLKNNSASARQIGLRLTKTDACAGSFTVTVKAGTAVITTAVFAGTYLTPSLAAGKYKDIVVSIKRVSAGCRDVRLQAESLNSGVTVRTSNLVTNASYNAVTD